MLVYEYRIQVVGNAYLFVIIYAGSLAEGIEMADPGTPPLKNNSERLPSAKVTFG